jgi:hypothetical protein
MNASIPRSDHFDGRRFHNPTGPIPQPFTAVPRLLMERGQPWPRWVNGSVTVPPALDGDAACVTFVGHATFLIQTAAANILTDPMYSMRAGPWNRLGPRRVRPPAVALADLPRIDIVLLSHNHYDHCDLRTLRMLAGRDEPLVVTLLGNRRLVESSGIRRVEELDWWQTSRQAPLPVTATPAHHFSARHPFDRNRALWGGFVIGVEGHRIYFAGDTAYTDLFTQVSHATRRAGPGPDSDRRLRAALVHACGAHEPGGSGAGPHRSGGGRERRHALRDVPVDHRADRRAGAGTRGRAAVQRAPVIRVPRDRSRRVAAAPVILAPSASAEAPFKAAQCQHRRALLFGCQNVRP